MKTLVGIICLLAGLVCVTPAFANAHCYCKIASWQSSPVAHPSGVVHDFGEIATYGSQSGHNNACKALCLTTSTTYFNNLDAAGQASLCAGQSLYGYYAVGGNDYKGAGELACPNVGSPKLWLKGQIPSGQYASVQIGVNRTLLPSGVKMKVCIVKIGGAGIFQELCHNYPNNTTIGLGSMTNATVTFNHVPRTTDYGVNVKRRTPMGPYISFAHIQIYVN